MAGTTADPWGTELSGTQRRLLEAGVKCFAERGYGATTTRDVARQAAMSPAGVYVHFPSKEALLFHISLVGHEASRRAIEAAGGNDGLADSLRRRVASFATWHARNHELARVVQYELPHLEPEHFDQIREIRQGIETIFRDDVRDGAKAGQFDVLDLDGTSRLLVSMCIDVARWYSPSQRSSGEQIGELYGAMALRIVGAGG